MTINYIKFLESINANLVQNLLTEEIHTELQGIMDSPNIHQNDKLDHVISRARELRREGKETGLIGDIPKRGSSRAVFFPRDSRTLNLDGIPAKIPSAIKIAFPGEFEERYRDVKKQPLLGQMQNEAEADKLMSHHHGIIRKDEHGNWHTNHDGVIPPLFDHHPDFHHIEVGRVSPYTDAKFREATKDGSFPNGINHQEFHDAIMHIYAVSHGMEGYHYGQTDHDHVKNVLVHHPFVKNVINFSADSGIHPNDFSPDNVGTWTHPHTGKLHPVLLDYGFRHNIAKHYVDMNDKEEARLRQHGVK